LNNKVRKVTAAGVVTTLAGSGSRGAIDATGSAASFWLPAALAVDSSGTVYVADQFNQKIRSISTAGVVTTLAGTGTAGAADAATGASATFNNPGGIALDGIGNVIIGDLDNHNIRKVTLPNTVVVGATFTNVATSTLAGGTYGAISYASAASGIASVNATTGVVTGLRRARRRSPRRKPRPRAPTRRRVSFTRSQSSPRPRPLLSRRPSEL
jgi:serine/threonine protein kinase, bacterial